MFSFKLLMLQRKIQAMFRRKKNKLIAVLLGFLLGFTVVQLLYPNIKCIFTAQPGRPERLLKEELIDRPCLKLYLHNRTCDWASYMFSIGKFNYFLFRGTSPIYSKSILDTLDLDCDAMWKRKNESKINELKKWKFDYKMLEIQLLYSNNTCASIHEFFDFLSLSNSQEEADYPLSYGILVYKNYVQVMFMLSSIYQPQNAYCIAVSDSATNEFKQLMKITQQCLPNVNVMFRPAISWGSFEIINSVYKCMESLTQLNIPWKYFQYLSGVDVPLKTNLEMVKIFKTLNESINFEIKPYPDGRYNTRKKDDAPIKLYKSSLSALIPRSAANFLVRANLTKNLMEYLSETGIPDESLWATVSGNTKDFPVPGSINAEDFLTNESLFNKIDNITMKKSHFGYYISRYQVWGGAGSCHGHWKSASCVYGVGDYERLIQQPHLIAHKMYIDSEPAAYFCVLKEIRNRTLNPVPFDVTPYSELPQVELKKGVPYKKLKRQDWILHMNGEL